MITVGVTGSVGTGKSTVCKMFERLGAIRLDADALAHEALEGNRQPYHRILRHFGRRILRKSGQIDRARLAAEVFTDPKQLDRLCRIVHPYVIQKMRQRIREIGHKNRSAVVVAEVPLLFEVGLGPMFDKTVTVWCDAGTQLKRCRKKEMSPNDLRLRKRAQLSLLEKRRRADHCVDTRGSFQRTARQVRTIWSSLKERED